MKKFKLNTKRTLEVEAICHEDNIYVRTREVAQVLGVKQQYEFVADIKRAIGIHKILKGKKTEELRTEDDTERTTFIKVEDLYFYLRNETLCHKIISSQKEGLLIELANMIMMKWENNKDGEN